MKLLRVKSVAEKLDASRSTVFRLMKSDDFPKPIKLSARHIVFVEAEIDQWVSSKRSIDERANELWRVS